MNIEKVVILTVLTLTAWSGYYLTTNRMEPVRYQARSTAPNITQTDEFNLASVLDNTPFESYHQPGKRNPFIPYQPPRNLTGTGTPSSVEGVNKGFKFPWKFGDPQPEPEKKAPPVPTKVAIAVIPDKPLDKPDAPPEKVDPETAKKDETIPVCLVGFVKTYGTDDPDRKAILANKTTGEIYTVRTGDELLGMTIAAITPSSIIIRMPSGRTVEFLHDILKNTP